MSGPERRQIWFIRERLGKFTLANWRGAVAFVVLVAILAAGGVTEDALRDRHPTLSIIAMAVLGSIALALVLLMNAHTENRRVDAPEDAEH